MVARFYHPINTEIKIIKINFGEGGGGVGLLGQKAGLPGITCIYSFEKWIVAIFVTILKVLHLIELKCYIILTHNKIRIQY